MCELFSIFYHNCYRRDKGVRDPDGRVTTEVPCPLVKQRQMLETSRVFVNVKRKSLYRECLYVSPSLPLPVRCTLSSVRVLLLP